MNARIEDQIEELRIFGRNVATESDASLDLLRRIEATVHWLVKLRARVDADCRYAAATAERVSSCQLAREIDPDDDISLTLERGVNSLQNLHRVLRSKQNDARTTDELAGEHKESVVTEYEQTIESVSHLHDCIEDLRWTLMNHDGRVSGVAASVGSDSELDSYFSKL